MSRSNAAAPETVVPSDATSWIEASKLSCVIQGKRSFTPVPL